MATTTKTVFLTDENGNLLVDSNGRPRALTFTVIEGKSLRLAERDMIPTVTFAELKTYSESVQTYTGITNTAKFSVEDVAVFQYIVSDRGNTRAYVTAQVSAVNDTSLTANGIGISVAGADGEKGDDGATPHIGDNKHWYIGEEDTGIVAEGKNGTTPHIGENKHWYIGETDTDILAEGKDGATPEIGENGNWYINGEDTGKSSKGANGLDGKSVTSATAGATSEENGYTITPVTFGMSDGSSLPAVPVKAKNAKVEIIDLGEVTLTEQSLGGNIKISMSDSITVSREQATQAQAETPPVVKVKIGGEYHEFYRTKISTDATAVYIYFTATEDLSESTGTKFYHLQITVSEYGGASAGLFVCNYNLLNGILNEFDIGTLTFTEDTATRTVTDDEWPLVQSANVMTFRIFDSSSSVDEHFKMYLTHYHAGESNPDNVDLYNRTYFGVVTTQSGTPYGYSAVYDSENKRIIVTKVSLRSGGGSSYTLPIASETVLGGVQPVIKTTEMTQEVGVDKTGKLWTTPTSGGSGGSGLAQNEIINREASIAIADENSPDFVENSGDLWVKRLLGYKAKVNTLEATLPSVRDCTSAATAPNGKIYVFGGNSFDGYSDDIFEFDPVTQSVTTLEATLPRGSYDTSAATAPNGKIYVFGGTSSGGTSQYFLDDILEFDPITQSVTTLEATLPSGRADTSAATAPNGKIYVFGGYDANSGSYLDDIIEFDPVTQSVTTLSETLPSVRFGTSAATAPNGKIYVFGGVLGSGRYLDDILEFDPVTQTVTTLEATLPSTRFGTSAATAPNGKIYVFGGVFGDRLDDILEFDPVTQSVTTLEATLPRGSYNTSAATAPNGKIYVFKGNSIGVGDFSDDILEFDPSIAQYTYSPAVVLSQEEYAQFKNILNGIFSRGISAPSATISGNVTATGAVTASSFNATM